MGVTDRRTPHHEGITPSWQRLRFTFAPSIVKSDLSLDLKIAALEGSSMSWVTGSLTNSVLRHDSPTIVNGQREDKEALRLNACSAAVTWQTCYFWQAGCGFDRGHEKMEDKLILNRERSACRVLTKRSESPERHDRGGGWAMGGKCSGLAKQKEVVKKEVISPALACSNNKHSRRKPHGMLVWSSVQFVDETDIRNFRSGKIMVFEEEAKILPAAYNWNKTMFHLKFLSLFVDLVMTKLFVTLNTKRGIFPLLIFMVWTIQTSDKEGAHQQRWNKLKNIAAILLPTSLSENSLSSFKGNHYHLTSLNMAAFRRIKIVRGKGAHCLSLSGRFGTPHWLSLLF